MDRGGVAWAAPRVVVSPWRSVPCRRGSGAGVIVVIRRVLRGSRLGASLCLRVFLRLSHVVCCVLERVWCSRLVAAGAPGPALRPRPAAALRPRVTAAAFAAAVSRLREAALERLEGPSGP